MTKLGQMIWEDGIEQGIERGMERGIEALILDNQEENKTEEQIYQKLMKRFSLSRDDADRYYKKYAKRG